MGSAASVPMIQAHSPATQERSAVSRDIKETGQSTDLVANDKKDPCEESLGTQNVARTEQDSPQRPLKKSTTAAMNENHAQADSSPSSTEPAPQDSNAVTTQHEQLHFHLEKALETVRKRYRKLQTRYQSLPAGIRGMRGFPDIASDTCAKELGSEGGASIGESLVIVDFFARSSSKAKMEGINCIARGFINVAIDRLKGLAVSLSELELAVEAHEKLLERVRKLPDGLQSQLAIVADFKANHARLLNQYENVSKATQDSEKIDVESRSICHTSFGAEIDGQSHFRDQMVRLQWSLKEVMAPNGARYLDKVSKYLQAIDSCITDIQSHLDSLAKAVEAHVAIDVASPEDAEVDAIKLPVRDGVVDEDGQGSESMPSLSASEEQAERLQKMEERIRNSDSLGRNIAAIFARKLREKVEEEANKSARDGLPSEAELTRMREYHESALTSIQKQLAVWRKRPQAEFEDMPSNKARRLNYDHGPEAFDEQSKAATATPDQKQSAGGLKRPRADLQDQQQDEDSEDCEPQSLVVKLKVPPEAPSKIDMANSSPRGASPDRLSDGGETSDDCEEGGVMLPFEQRFDALSLLQVGPLR